MSTEFSPLPSRLRMRSMPLTAKALFIVTSNPPISSSQNGTMPRFSTSAWRKVCFRRVLQAISPHIRLNPDISPALQEVIRRALEKDKNLRYQHASDVRAELQRLKRDTESGRRVAEEETEPVLLSTLSRPSSSGKQKARTSSVQTAGLRPQRVSKIIDSIAVLPFENASGDPEHEYLSDGITGSLINILATIPKLRVMAQSTVSRYKGRAIDPQVVGRELN